MRSCVRCVILWKDPAGIYLFKVNIGNTGRVSEVCSILLVKSPERLQLRRFNVLLVKLKVFHTFFVCFSCWLRTGKCLLGYRRPLVNFENSQRLQSSKVPAYSCLRLSVAVCDSPVVVCDSSLVLCDLSVFVCDSSLVLLMISSFSFFLLLAIYSEMFRSDLRT